MTGSRASISRLLPAIATMRSWRRLLISVMASASSASVATAARSRSSSTSARSAGVAFAAASPAA